MIKLDIYREIRADAIRPDMVVSCYSDTGDPLPPMVVASVELARGGQIRLRIDGSTRLVALSPGDTLRLHPSGDDLDKVWVGVTDAVRAAVADWVERHDGEEVAEAPPWEVIDAAGNLSIVASHTRYRVDRLAEPE